MYVNNTSANGQIQTKSARNVIKHYPDIPELYYMTTELSMVIRERQRNYQ